MGRVPIPKPGFLDGCEYLEYNAGRVTADQIDDFVDYWPESGDEETRSLSDYLGVTEQEYGLLVITDRALPAILAARRANRPLREFVAPLFDRLRSADDPEDKPVLHAMAYLLQHHLAEQGQNFSTHGRNSTSHVQALRCWFATYQ